MKLTKEQLDFFKKNGFLIIKGFLEKTECKVILDVAKVHLKHKIEPIETEEEYNNESKDCRKNREKYNSRFQDKNQTVRRLRQVYSRDIVFKRWMENRKICPILKQLLDEEAILITAHHNSIMTKMPYDSTQTRWHQDKRYWHFEGDNLISVWLALGQENGRNGALEFIPQSHKMEFKAELFDDKEYFKENHPSNMSLIETKVSTNLEMGDVVIFHSLLLHRANANLSDKPKISFVYTVKGVSVKSIEKTRSSKYPEIPLQNCE